MEFWKQMFLIAYTEPYKIAYSLMLKKIVAESDPYFNFVHKLSSLDTFLKLSDFDVFELIKILKERKECQDFIERFEWKEYYYFCGHLFFKDNYVKS